MILIINNQDGDGYTASSILYYMGILSRTVSEASVVRYAGRLLCGCRAVMVMTPEGLEDEERVLTLISSISSVPLYAIGKASKEKYNGVFSKIDSSVISEISYICGAGAYSLGNIDASVTRVDARSGETKLPFTKTEIMILRYLIASYPTAQNADSILRYCFRTARMPEAASVRTHISVMNKKYRGLLGINLIESVHDEGYTITDRVLPEYEIERSALLS